METKNQPRPWMTDEEISFLEARLKPSDRVWEFGSGGSTRWFAGRCRHVTTVEHRPDFALRAIAGAPANVAVLFVPPSAPHVEGSGDGDPASFSRYVETYQGRDVDVVLIDGRARVACARQVAEKKPPRELRVFVHDAQRGAYRPIWEDDLEAGHRAWFVERRRVGNLILLAPRC
jgi:hypothetical protein